MKRFQIGKTVFAFIMAMTVLLGCSQEEEQTPPNSDASLKSISLNGEAFSSAAGVTSDEWVNPLFDLSGIPVAHLYADSETSLASAVISATPNSLRAAVQYGQGTDSGGPQVWSKTGTFSLQDNDYVYISVLSSDRSVRYFYKAQVHVSSDVATVVTIKVAGKGAGMEPPVETLDEVSLGTINLAFGTENINASVEAPKDNAGASVQFAKVEAGSNTVPQFSDTANFTFDDGDILYVKSVSSDGTKTLYYAVRVRAPRITAVSFDPSGTPAAVNAVIDAPGNEWNTGEEGLLSLSLPAQSQGTLSITPAENVQVEWAQAALNAESAPSFAPLSEAEITLGRQEAIYLKAVYMEVYTGLPTDKYYRIAVKSNDNTLASIGVGTETATPGVPNANPLAAGAVNVVVGETAQNGVTVNAVPTDAEYAAVKYAVTTDSTTEPEYGDVNTFDFPIGQTFLYIQVTAENGAVTNYKFAVGVGNGDTSLSSVTVAGVNVTDLGTPGQETAGAYGPVISGYTAGSVSIPGPLGADTAVTADVNALSTVDWASAAEFFGSLFLNGTYGTGPLTLGTSGYFNYNLVVLRVTAQNGAQAFYVLTVTAQ
ncbi:MAG: hypothetical protein LBG05_00650 [Treponema sp.]|nr:hypothetical protein [Treponema sp.]